MTTLVDDTGSTRALTSANQPRIALSGEGGYAEGLSAPTITRRPSAALPPLSFAQQQVWVHAQLAPDIPLYNEIMVLERKGPLIQKAVEQSFCEITRRHETLRTTFPAVDNVPVQVITQRLAARLMSTAFGVS